MKDYIKPCIRENNPNHEIIHVGTNKSDSKRQTEMIAKSIIDVAKSVRTNTRTVTRSHGMTTLIIKRWMSMMNFRKCAERLN